MKKLLSLLTLLVVAISTSWAGTTPDYESYDWADADEMATGLAGDDAVVITVQTGGSAGNVSGHYYTPLNSAIDGAAGTYLQVSSAQQIEKIDIFFCPNGTSNTNLAWAAWGEDVTPSAEVGTNYGTTADYKASKSWDAATWQTIDLSEIEAYTVRISRQGKNLTNNGNKISNFGDNQTVNVLGIRVYLASGTTHTVTYDLGAATAGTAPTQDAVGEGSKFTVANAPTDLVAPEGKDFKCWNDGTDDYAEGDKYTMGTSDVILTAVYADKYAVSYAAGDGTGTMDGAEVAEGKKITLPASTFTAPAGKTFKNWLCSADNNTYEAGAEYTMTAEATTFTAQWVGYDTYLLPATSGDAPTSGDAIAMQTGSFGGSMTALSENLSYTTNGLQFGTNSSTKASVTLNKKIQEGTVITLTLVSAGTSARGLKLYNSDGSKQITTLGWTSETENGAEETFSYIVKASDTGIIGNSGFQLWRNNTVQLKSLTVAKCGDAVLEAITIPSDGVLTYVTQNPVDFSSIDGTIKAYVVTATSTTSATTAEVAAVPAGTPLLIKGVAGDYDVEVVESAEAPAANLLQVSDGTVTGGDNIYAYSKSALKFKKVAATVTIPEGKCYLEIDGNGGDALDIIFDGEATGINDVNAGAEAVAPVKVLTAKGVQIGKFNVAGQQVK
jgi:hypothetical protein